jgi:hypothetical protein
MNNIEILEEYFNKICFDETNKITADLCTIGINEIRAIENLIKENKELKEKNKSIIEKSARLIEGRDTVIQQNRKEVLNYVKENYIPKSKVKEKMQNDIKTNEHVILGGRRNGKTLEYGKRLGRIEMCEELLGEN